jgi:hypothetical protein
MSVHPNELEGGWIASAQSASMSTLGTGWSLAIALSVGGHSQNTSSWGQGYDPVVAEGENLHQFCAPDKFDKHSFGVTSLLQYDDAKT